MGNEKAEKTNSTNAVSPTNQKTKQTTNTKEEGTTDHDMMTQTIHQSVTREDPAPRTPHLTTTNRITITNETIKTTDQKDQHPQCKDNHMNRDTTTRNGFHTKITNQITTRENTTIANTTKTETDRS